MGGQVQETAHTRASDGRGRHTTTVRQLFVLDGGALMIDNPGLREVGIGMASAGIADTFPDILELAEAAGSRTTRHEREPGVRCRWQCVREPWLHRGPRELFS